MGFSEDAIKLLKGKQWPGNFRELKNFVEKVVTLENGKFIDKNIIKKYLFQSDDNIYGQQIDKNYANTSVALVSTVKKDIIGSDTLILWTLLELKQDITDIKRALELLVIQ